MNRRAFLSMSGAALLASLLREDATAKNPVSAISFAQLKAIARDLLPVSREEVGYRGAATFGRA
jgi:hypothetical protein